MKNLVSLREESGLSQQKLADEIGISQQSINQYENTNTQPSIEIMIQLADFFNTTVDYLIGNSEVREKEIKLEDLMVDKKDLAHLKAFKELTPRDQQIVDNLIQDLLKLKE